jgi:hypothetical protein
MSISSDYRNRAVDSTWISLVFLLLDFVLFGRSMLRPYIFGFPENWVCQYRGSIVTPECFNRGSSPKFACGEHGRTTAKNMLE